jgi:nicotinate-nucleotide adenylyltransferase
MSRATSGSEASSDSEAASTSRSASPGAALPGGRRVAVFGGSFDPVHHGHLIAAEEARWALGLDRVLFVPAAVPPHKPGDELASAAHRLAMLELALAGNPGFAISRVDLDRPGPHFTVDMLALVAETQPPGTELFFLLGADSLRDLPTWRDPAGILARARLAVVARPGYEPDLAALSRLLPQLGERLHRVPVPPIGIAASDLERRVREGRPIRYQLPAAVEDYIRAQGLYRAKPQSAP